MRVFIDATEKIGDSYLLDKAILGLPLLEYSFLLAKEIGADSILLDAPQERQKECRELSSRYFKNYEIYSPAAKEDFDLRLNIKNIYNIDLAAKSYLRLKNLDQALIWSINDEKGLRAAEEELRRTRWFPIGRYYIVQIAKFLADKLSRTGVTPNQVTMVSFLLVVVSSVLLLFRYWPFYIISALCYLSAWILDITDGKLARKKNVVSSFGAWFDPVIGEAMDYITHFFIILSLYFREHHLIVVWIGCFYFIGKHLTIFAMQMSQDKLKAAAEGQGCLVGNGLMRIFSEATHFIHDADVRVHFLTLAILLNVTILPLTFYAIYYNIWFISKLALEYARYRKDVS